MWRAHEDGNISKMVDSRLAQDQPRSRDAEEFGDDRELDTIAHILR